MPRYPLMNLIPGGLSGGCATAFNGGGSSRGFGYTARALIERRVTANWFVGALRCRYSAGERLYPQSSGRWRPLFRGGLAGGYGFGRRSPAPYADW